MGSILIVANAITLARITKSTLADGDAAVTDCYVAATDLHLHMHVRHLPSTYCARYTLQWRHCTTTADDDSFCTRCSKGEGATNTF
jgi:hypothetical protein